MISGATIPYMRNVWLIACSFFFIFFGFGTAQLYLVVLFNDQGRGQLALLSLLLVYGAFLVASIFISKLVPLLGGLKRSLIVGASTYVLFVASVALATTSLLLIASVVVGIGAGLLWVSSTQITADSSTARNAGRNFGLQTATQNIGNIAGILTGGYLVHTLPISSMYLILSAVALAGLVLLSWVRPPREELEHRSFKTFFAFDKRMLALFPVLFGFSFLAGQAFTAMNVIIVALLGLGAIPLVIGIFRVSNIAGSLSIGTISDWFSRSLVIAFLIIVGLIGIVLFTTTRALAPLLIGVICIGVSLSALPPVCLAWMKERLHNEEYLHAFGIFYVYSNIGVVAAVISNLYLSPRASFIPVIVAFLLALPGILLFQSFTQKDRR